ncbi:hypothetical protein BCR34DRAFT_609840 [Clohesyomyces aquaticus]|uniref:Uncharacterized protein n=1 Tax=Clohesyomyces aquaticus TaxID=1231657 RepID=A0A1Y2A9M1_9PLEO|nr:hypothetical protein BCR34DRAFT_609840 [Clohesyomyces aquaticus]
MHFGNTIISLVALTAGTASAYATNFDVFSDGGCRAYDVTFSTDVSDGGCYQIGGYGSVRTSSVKSGCSLTIYTDSTCSANAIVAGVGACITTIGGAKFYSYSVDC